MDLLQLHHHQLLLDILELLLVKHLHKLLMEILDNNLKQHQKILYILQLQLHLLQMK